MTVLAVIITTTATAVMWPTYSWPNAFIIPFAIVIVIALFCRAFPAETDLVLGALLMIGTILFSLLTGPFVVCAVVPVRAMCVVRASAKRTAIWIVTYVVFGACVGLVTFVGLHAKKKGEKGVIRKMICKP